MIYTVTSAPTSQSVAASTGALVNSNAITVVISKGTKITIKNFSCFVGEEDTAAKINLYTVYAYIAGFTAGGSTATPMLSNHALPQLVPPLTATAGAGYYFQLMDWEDMTIEDGDTYPGRTLTFIAQAQVVNTDAGGAHTCRIRPYLIYAVA